MASLQIWDAHFSANLWNEIEDFEASEDIMSKFKSQDLHIKYWNADGSGNPPFLIFALWNIGISLHKLATCAKHFEPQYK